MFGETKYIVVSGDLAEEMVIFGVTQKHADIANSLGRPVISAGFLEVRTGSDEEVYVACFGDSFSLGVESRPEADSKIAARILAAEVDPTQR